MLYSLATIFVVFVLGGPPQSIKECFVMLKENRITGLLRLDVLTVFVIPLYFVLFYSIYRILKEVHQDMVNISTIFVFVGVTIFLAAPSVFSYSRLSDAYWLSDNDGEKSKYIAAAEAILVSDIWNGTGPRISALLVQLGATTLSFVMLRSIFFPKVTSYLGIATHGLDFLHAIAAFFAPTLSNDLISVAGVLYLLWFPLMAYSLFKLSNFWPDSNKIE